MNSPLSFGPSVTQFSEKLISEEFIKVTGSFLRKILVFRKMGQNWFILNFLRNFAISFP